MAGYTRQDVSNNIANGNVVDADDLDAEFDALAVAFNISSGHTHDGTAGEGAPITVVGPDQDVSVSSSAVLPKTDDVYDLGSSALQFKDLYIDGVAYLDSINADAGTVGGSAIATLTATQTLTNKTLTSPDINGGTVDGITALSVSGNITVTGTVDGRDLAADGTKLDGIESGATADQTAGEIKTAYESNADTNAFTDAEKTRLGLVTDTEMGILAGATVTTAELNYLDITTLGTSEASKAVTADSGGQVIIDGTYAGNITAVAALDIDCSSGNYFTKTIAANSTFTFSNVPTSVSYAFTLEITHTSGTITWPASVKWAADLVPSLTTGKTHLFMFVTDDGGTRWRGSALVDYTN